MATVRRVKQYLSVTNPELAKEWDFNKNYPLTPNEVTPGSNRKVWWICNKCSHNWQTTIYVRTTGHGCPNCSISKRKEKYHKFVLSHRKPLAESHPKLLSEWDYEKNKQICSPTETTSGTNTKVWWLCPKNHSYSASIANRTKGRGCPYCSGKKALRGFNDLASIKPELAEEWNYEKNAPLTPSDVTIGSSKKVWWKCHICGNQWLATIYNRNINTKCPECKRKRKKQNTSTKTLSSNYGKKLAYANPELAKEWDYEKNKPITPNDVTIGSSLKVWWLCPIGHSYESTVSHRNSGRNCPYCSGKKVLSGFNDLETLFPEIAKEWDIEKNYPLKPNMVTRGSTKKVWWICPNNHSYPAIISNRTLKNAGCPYCSNHKVLFGYNDLFTWCINNQQTNIIDEWNDDKNIPLTPKNVAHSSNKYVWWKCSLGHEWKSQIYSRTSTQGCPVCAKELKTSFPEQAIFFYVKKFFPDAINGEKTTIGEELDIYIPSLQTAIEYDGIAWHKNKEKEERKTNKCLLAGIRLIRIREKGLSECKDCINIVRNHNTSDESLEDCIKKAISIIDQSIVSDINIKRDRTNIYSMFIYNQKQNSLEATHPEIAKEWHPTKNGSLRPANVSPSSNKKVWWKCSKCSTEWETQISVRSSGSGCPNCGREKLIVNRNKNRRRLKGSLADNNPTLAKEWDYIKNSPLTPDMFTTGSIESVWWICNNNHSWKAIIGNRSKGRGCPYCARKRRADSQSKSVICIETGIIYKSATEAGALLGINRISILNCCKNKQKTAGGFHWKYNSDN